MYISFNQNFIREEEAHSDMMPWIWQPQKCTILEDVRANAAHPLLIDKHFDAILGKAKLLQISLPYFFDCQFLSKQIEGLLTRNKLYQAANVRIILIRNTNANQTDVLMNCSFAGQGTYELNRKGLLIDIFDKAYVTAHSPYQLNQFCQIVNDMAKSAAANSKLDDMLLITEQGFIVSATESTFFAVSGKKILTPPAEIGARRDVLSELVIEAACNLGYRVDIEALVMKEDLPTLDEVFLCDTANGLQWVGGYKNRRYIHKESSLINTELNKILFGQTDIRSPQV
jgi:branched-chain amino acid aminotransferase